MVKFDKGKYDLNEDGTLDNEELESADDALELELKEEKADSQRRMAWVAMASILGFTLLMFMPFVPIDRLAMLSDLLSMFYIAQAGIVGAYFGMTAWMSRN